MRHLQSISIDHRWRSSIVLTKMIPILLGRKLRSRFITDPVPELRRLSLEFAGFILRIDPVVNALLVVGLWESCQKTLTTNSLGNFHGPSLTDIVAASPRVAVVGCNCAAKSLVRERALSIYRRTKQKVRDCLVFRLCGFEAEVLV